MRSLKSCWNYLRQSSGNHVIISLGAGAYDVLPLGPNTRGESFLEASPGRVVGVYSSSADWDSIAEDAEEQLRAQSTHLKD
jgi:hypothetical protein